jgi:hypothetical protein
MAAMSTGLASSVQALSLAKSDFAGRSVSSRVATPSLVNKSNRLVVKAAGYSDELVKTAVSLQMQTCKCTHSRRHRAGGYFSGQCFMNDLDYQMKSSSGAFGTQCMHFHRGHGHLPSQVDYAYCLLSIPMAID